MRKSEEKQFQLFFRREFSTKRFTLSKDLVKSISGAESCRVCSPCAWAYRVGKWSSDYSWQVEFNFHKKDFCAFSAEQFWQTSVQISPNSSTQYQRQWFLSKNNSAECSYRNQINRAHTWLAQFYRRGNNNLKFKTFFSMGIRLCFDRTIVTHEIVLILCIHSTITWRVTELITSQKEKQSLRVQSKKISQNTDTSFAKGLTKIKL